MVIFIKTGHYAVVIKDKNYLRFSYAFPQYSDSHLQLILENNVILVKKKGSDDWWLLTQKELVKASDFLFTWDDKGIYVNNFNFEYGVLYVNDGKDENDLGSIVYFIGILIYYRFSTIRDTFSNG